MKQYPVYSSKVNGIPKNMVIPKFVVANGWYEWRAIVSYLKTISGIRTSICEQCGYATLYDKYNLPYRISRRNQLSEVKETVNKIIEINKSEVIK